MESTDSHDALELTGLERRVATLLATHLSFREIGLILGISRDEVHLLAVDVYRRLEVAG